ncbi:hypothetical protein Q0590_36395 [Rhodocytophaga aerolata]|uniref:Uncharacterized protein n=1 Tax=Rhodocytophaga aerolata TaxID=455078 RepID=A0ABT8RL91_9BACT|nr:hypothetical protein [Rhodocytophaga aerolata]MDO1451812.1 hypothetical protein [Rhodocytophaga aerolata]
MDSLKNRSIEQIKAHSRYFARNSKDNSRFIPELEGCNKIIAIIDKEVIQPADLAQIAEALNQVEEQDHFNGSGWESFGFCVASFARSLGYRMITNQKGEIEITK